MCDTGDCEQRPFCRGDHPARVPPARDAAWAQGGEQSMGRCVAETMGGITIAASLTRMRPFWVS